MAGLPGHRADVLDRDGHHTSPWRHYFEALERALLVSGNSKSDTDAQIAAIARALGSPDGTVANIPAQFNPGAVDIHGINGIYVDGSLASGSVVIRGSGDGSAGMPAVMARLALGVR